MHQNRKFLRRAQDILSATPSYQHAYLHCVLWVTSQDGTGSLSRDQYPGNQKMGIPGSCTCIILHSHYTLYVLRIHPEVPRYPARRQHLANPQNIERGCNATRTCLSMMLVGCTFGRARAKYRVPRWCRCGCNPAELGSATHRSHSISR